MCRVKLQSRTVHLRNIDVGNAKVLNLEDSISAFMLNYSASVWWHYARDDAMLVLFGRTVGQLATAVDATFVI
jgi:hypothetical protein